MAPPFRADQVGSLLRPPDLITARNALKADPSNPSLKSSLQKVQNKAIAETIQQQKSHSILPLVDGEFGREIYYSGFFENLTGFSGGFDAHQSLSLDSPKWRKHFPTHQRLREQGVKARPAVICTGKVAWEKGLYLDDWLYVRSLVKEEEWENLKMTLPSVTFMHMNFTDGQAYTADSGYKSDREFLMDLAAAFRKEVQTLYDAGCRVIQVDDPNLSYFCNERFREACAKDGYGLDALLQLYTEVHNACLADLPKDLHVGVHICRGNAPNSTFYSSGGYERIASVVLEQMAYKLFYLEFDDVSRTGDFAPLRHLPVDKAVVLGVVTTKGPEMENLAELKEKVLEAAEVIAKGQGGGRTKEQVLKDNLAVSPQCGFSSASYGHGMGMTEEVMWKKLELVRDLAADLWSGA